MSKKKKNQAPSEENDYLTDTMAEKNIKSFPQSHTYLSIFIPLHI